MTTDNYCKAVRLYGLLVCFPITPISHDVNDLCVEFETQLAFLAEKMKRNEEVTALKTANLVTTHAQRIREVICFHDK